MEAAFGMSSLATKTNAVKFYYSKRKESAATKDLTRSATSRPIPPPPPCTIDDLEIGAFYEIDHENLPPKSPIHLKAVRVVKVGETTKLDVTVSFPSTYSLRNYFSSIATNPSGDQFPELDERFVMSTNQAKKIIKRLVPTRKLSEEKNLQSFWLVAPFVLPCSTVAAAHSTAEEEEEEEEEEGAEGTTKMGALQSVLKHSGKLQWGIRRKVKYIGRQQRDQLLFPAVKMEEDKNEGEVMDVQNVIRTRKRTRNASCKKSKGRKERKEKEEEEEKKKKREKRKARYEKCKGQGTERGSKERWSTERYESAELKLLDIMRDKGAAPGNSILRQELREEARKHIGDTGLLDHLLKHMAGKVVNNGSDRFRRRHNAEGAMEYWLEPAELEEVRNKAGVTDPYWLPPSGWKPGGAVSACILCGTECQKEISLLREQINILKRDMVELQSLKQLEKEAKDECQSEAAGGLQVKYEMLMKRNAKLEEELQELAGMLKGMKGEMALIKQEKAEKIDVEPAVDKMDVEQSKSDGGNGSNGAVDGNTAINSEKKTNSGCVVGDQSGKKKGTVRRSGFRICRPQGTFLWPNMTSTGVQLLGGGAAGINNGNNINNISSSSSSAAAVYSKMSNTTGTITATSSAGTGLMGLQQLQVPTTKAMVEYNEYCQQQKQLAMVFGNNYTNGGTNSNWGSGYGACNGIPTPPSCSSATSTPKLLLLPSPTSTRRSSTGTALSSQSEAAVSVQACNSNDGTCSLAPTSLAGDHQMNKMKDTVAAVHVHGAAWRSTITTDLVLATPSHSSI